MSRHASDAYMSSEFDDEERIQLVLDDLLDHNIDRFEASKRITSILKPGNIDDIPAAEDHLVDMTVDNFDMLHFCGKEGDACEVFTDLRKKYEDNGGRCPMRLGKYDVTRYSDGLIEYTLRVAGDLA